MNSVMVQLEVCEETELLHGRFWSHMTLVVDICGFKSLSGNCLTLLRFVQ
jgi:hypothetical protein